MTDAAAPVLAAIRGGLVVSCQAPPGDPLRDPEVLARMAASVVRAGAIGVRVNGVEVVRRTRALVTTPVIGLWKDGDEGVYITPTARHALDVAAAGADIVAVDATARPRPDGRTLADTVAAIHQQTKALVLADVSTVDEGAAAVDAGADAVATTLSGYTGPGAPPAGPDLELVAALAGKLGVPVIAEGRIHSPEQARAALDAGAWAVVVGTAITSPAWLTGQYRAALAA
ncbi:N-acetylmannosamine-6-phosphate 2-epimerase [Hamadaea sp. NPDC051192]|uniref:N-acetylmannosamine-6-phosphate 2-epimerase n=1 Tax=Hamadaea sp. NPDC051192 TaxID=3154940 RepID=UPI00344AF6A6